MDISLIFYAAIAAFLCYQLYSVLGTRSGHEPAPRKVDEPDTDQAESAYREAEPKALPDWAQPIAAKYPAFDPDQFIAGAKGAYEMIVTAFANGDLREVKPFLAPPVFKAFSAAVKSRRDAGQTSELQFVGIDSAAVVDTSEVDGQLKATVSFMSDQIRVLKDRDGNIIEGDPNRIDLVRDVWTFSRPVRSNDPNWILSATGAASPAGH